MLDDVVDIVELLESLLEDSPHKVKVELEVAIKLLEKAETSEDLMNVQDQLEVVSNINNLDAFISSEIYNLLPVIENLIQSI